MAHTYNKKSKRVSKCLSECYFIKKKEKKKQVINIVAMQLSLRAKF